MRRIMEIGVGIVAFLGALALMPGMPGVEPGATNATSRRRRKAAATHPN